MSREFPDFNTVYCWSLGSLMWVVLNVKLDRHLWSYACQSNFNFNCLFLHHSTHKEYRDWCEIYLGWFKNIKQDHGKWLTEFINQWFWDFLVHKTFYQINFALFCHHHCSARPSTMCCQLEQCGVGVQILAKYILFTTGDMM